MTFANVSHTYYCKCMAYILQQYEYVGDVFSFTKRQYIVGCLVQMYRWHISANVSPRYYCKSMYRLYITAALMCWRCIFFCKRQYIVGCLVQIYQLRITAKLSPRYYCTSVHRLHNTAALICRRYIFFHKKRYIVGCLLQMYRLDITANQCIACIIQQHEYVGDTFSFEEGDTLSDVFCKCIS